MAKRKKSARTPEQLHTVTLRLPREHAQVLAHAAQLAGLDVSTVARVILALGILRELSRQDAAQQLDRVEVARKVVRRSHQRRHR